MLFVNSNVFLVFFYKGFFTVSLAPINRQYVGDVLLWEEITKNCQTEMSWLTDLAVQWCRWAHWAAGTVWGFSPSQLLLAAERASWGGVVSAWIAQHPRALRPEFHPQALLLPLPRHSAPLKELGWTTCWRWVSLAGCSACCWSCGLRDAPGQLVNLVLPLLLLAASRQAAGDQQWALTPQQGTRSVLMKTALVGRWSVLTFALVSVHSQKNK